MKNLSKLPLRGLAAILIGLALFNTSSVSANSADENKADKSDEFSAYNNEFASVTIEDIVLVEEYPKVIVIFDENEQLVYDADVADLEYDPVLEILLRRSDFLLQVDGVSYYRLDQ